MAPDRGCMRWRWLALAAAGAPWSFAVERSKAVQVRPEGHPGHGYRTMKSKASWRFREEDDDKHRLLMKLRNPQTKRRELAETVAALQQRRLLTEAREYTLTIKVLGQLGLWREAVGMLRDMERNGVSPDVITYNAAIMALSRNKRWKEAIELVAEMWSVQITPDVISYTSAISACASTGHWKEALQLLAEMERAGIRADVRIFNAAVNACAQAGESARALQLLDSMPERKLAPDVITYNAAINACAQSGEYQAAFQLIARMKAQGLIPQTRTYNSAINACEKAFRGEETLQLLDDMVDTKARPDAVTFNTAMSACLKGGMPDQALSLLEEWHRCLTCLEFCAKSQMLLSAGFDNYISIWDPSAGTLSFKLEGHECSIAGLCAMPETDYEFMSVDFEGMVRLWDVRRLCCIQNFHATDRRAEEAGELERLEPRALCPLNRDRVVISGRRIVVFDRDANDPKVTSDWPINDLAFNHWTMEIVTPIKNDLYVWDALTGQRLQIHDNVIESNITAIKFGLKERRLFVGSEDGEIHCINAACGAKLKVLSPHTYEVTQIECMSGKVLTLSAPEKVINVHDDTGEKKALLLKRIDLSDVGVILRFAHDDREMLAVTSEEGDVGWYSADFAKPIADTSQCSVNHSQAVYCCEYFRNVPLIITTDNCSAIFWSVPPLRAYDFFNKIMLDLPGAEEGAVSISSMCLSWPDECTLFVGTDRGAILCVDITTVVQSAGRQREEILRRKESGERAEVISGRIFDSLPKPVNSNEYVFFLDSIWTVEKAHGLSVESILFCKRQPSVLMTLGADNCLRIWDHATGSPLGSLEQGLPEGLIYERSTAWSFPLDPHLQIQSDINALMEASAKSEDLDAERLRSPEDGHSLQHLAQRQTEECIAKLKKDRRRSIQMARSNSSPALAGQELPKFGFSNANLGQEFSAAAPRYLQGKKLCDKKTQDWYAGSLAPGYSLPQLRSGLSRPPASETKKVLEAARALAVSLGIRNSHDVLTP